VSPELAALVAGIGPSAALVAGIIGFLLRRTRAQNRLIQRMRIHLVTTCLDKSEGIEKLAELLLSDGEEG
jgi:hypothetical protein